MLVRVHNLEYLEDFGLLRGNWVDLFENGRVAVQPKLNLSPVTKVNVLWLDKDVKVSCMVASTTEEKRRGLSDYEDLGENSGMYFPYPGGASVTFHQGGVKFPLDVLFLQQDRVAKIERNTRVGSTDFWQADCDGVIEVTGGFCKLNFVEKNDRIALFAVSERDEREFRDEQLRDIQNLMGFLAESA